METGAAPVSATVTAAQRSLKQKGFYKGNLDGDMGPETRAAVREYQKNSNLNVTGRLDQATLSSLGVSK
ncbi:MAG TPA: peptidoglycan-binding domain-containing protein [Bryobacteraceae bacterium]|nr:peptidoglycan-binding domain-containing protein [Bryobacteraceae bacterium]